MKTLFYVVGGVVCLGLIIFAMYTAMTIGLSVYIVYENNLRGRDYAAKQQAEQAQQQKDGIAAWGKDMTPQAIEARKQKEKDEAAGKAPSLFSDPGDYGTEDNWLAAQISREMAEMAFFAAQPGSPLPDFKVKATVDPAPPQVHVEIEGGAAGMTAIDLKPAFAWDANGYAPLARQLAGTTAGTNDGPDHDVLADLLQLTGLKLAEADVRISANLQAHPASWQDHEAAALLLMALALRDEESTYTDIRPLLCRATAHLALAQAWRGQAQATWPGLIADAGIRSLAGRETDALEHLNGLSSQPDLPVAARSWISTLLVRATQDWRKADVTEKSPLLLKIVWFRMLEENLDNDEPSNRLFIALPKPAVDLTVPPDQQKQNPDTLVPDWGRIAGKSPYYDDADDPVKNAEYKLDLELHELDEILKVEQAPPPDVEHLGTVFAEGATDSIATDGAGKTVVRVIGPGGFKASSRGHLLDGLIVRDMRDESNQGDPAQMQNLFAKMETLFQGVPGYELARLHLDLLPFDAPQKQYADWLAAKKTWPVWEVPIPMAMGMPGDGRVSAFYRSAVPFGTVYQPGLNFRYGLINAVDAVEMPPFDTPELERIKQLPMKEANAALEVYSKKYNDQLRLTQPKEPTPFEQELLKLDPDEYDLAQDHRPNDKLLPAMTRFLDYNMNPIERIESLEAGHLSDADRIMVLRKHVALEPAFGFRAGVVLRGKGLPDEAAEMERKAFASNENPIGISNAVLPLVDYDLSHGLNDEALKVAKFAGDVASEMGLSTYTFALEKLGRLDEAEAAAKQDSQMYGDPAWIRDFQLRHPDRYPQVYADELKRAFPDGLVHAKLADFTGAPANGDQVTSDSDTLRAVGLQPGDVIVALDGYKVESDAQYMFVRALSSASTMDFIFWRGGKYSEISALVPGRRMMVDLQDYPAKAP